MFSFVLEKDPWICSCCTERETEAPRGTGDGHVGCPVGSICSVSFGCCSGLCLVRLDRAGGKNAGAGSQERGAMDHGQGSLGGAGPLVP